MTQIGLGDALRKYRKDVEGLSTSIHCCQWMYADSTHRRYTTKYKVYTDGLSKLSMDDVVGVAAHQRYVVLIPIQIELCQEPL